MNLFEGSRPLSPPMPGCSTATPASYAMKGPRARAAGSGANLSTPARPLPM